MKTHVQYTIQLKCKHCKHENIKTLLLPLKTRVRIGCSQCHDEMTTILFVVLEYASWSCTDSDVDVKIIK
jgi:hypothetical protein